MSDKRKKLTAEQVEQIRERREAGEKLKPIAEHFGVSIQQICRIAQGYRWKKG